MYACVCIFIFRLEIKRLVSELLSNVARADQKIDTPLSIKPHPHSSLIAIAYACACVCGLRAERALSHVAMNEPSPDQYFEVAARLMKFLVAP